jgi:hypothetical protein
VERNRQQTFGDARQRRGWLSSRCGGGSVLTLAFGGWGKEFFRLMREIGKKKKFIVFCSIILLIYKVSSFIQSFHTICKLSNNSLFPLC